MKLPCRVPKVIALGCFVLLGACSSSSEKGSGGTHGGTGGTPGSGGMVGSGGTTGSGGAAGTGGMAGTGGTVGRGGTVSTGGTVGSGSTASSGGTVGTGTATGGQTGDAGVGHTGTGGTGQAGAGGSGGAAPGSGGQAGSAIDGGGTLVSSCTGTAWPTADPTSTGPSAIITEKNVGPVAGAVPDPIYGNTRQQFNIYRPKTLGEGGRCHPILIWANGHGDNPEQNPPLCPAGCGNYGTVITQMASHGFVVIASLSSITSVADPLQDNKLPGIVGLDWLLQQAEDPSSPYYHHLDTAHIGALGHSQGGAATCISASDPRISAIATVSGTSANTGIHQPTLLFCGGKEAASVCTTIKSLSTSITTVPSMFVDNLASDHGGWLYQNGPKGPDIFAMTAWFRYWLMADTAQKKYFFGSDCTLCTDSRLDVWRNTLLTQ